MLGVRNPAFLGGIGLYATGGTVSEITVGSDNYRVHQFTPTGTSTLTVHGSGPVEYLIIAGGGGGGQPGFCGGGGGAGGKLDQYVSTNQDSCTSVSCPPSMRMPV